MGATLTVRLVDSVLVVVPVTSLVIGTVEVTVAVNSATTLNGRSGCPSGDWSPPLLAPPAGGTVPAPVIAARAGRHRSGLLEVLGHEPAHTSGGGRCGSGRSRTSPTRPISNVATARNGGPVTVSRAER
jgi:hypothetical protein